ncbi:MAG: helix-hairpin-helix domain-containing protein [Myxococcota bacterium]
MIRRKEIVNVLRRLAFAADLKGDKRAKAWSGAAWAIRQLDEDLAVMVEERRLARVRGVGPATSALVADLLDGIQPRVLEEMEAEIPAGLFEIQRIKGLGAKKIKMLWEDLGITTVGELEYACRENRLVDLKGFGVKTQSKVLAQIEMLRANAGKRRRDRAAAVVEPFLASLVHKGIRCALVGDLPRGMELIEDLRVVVDRAPEGEVPEGVKVDVATGAWGWAVLRRTSSEAHQAALQERAASKGLTLDDLDADSEEDVYRALGLLPTPAERREADVPLVGSGSATTPLVRREDLRGALHNHTTASDGSHTLAQMQQAAAAAGLAYLGISEHSVSAFYAGGLDSTRLQDQRKAIDERNAAAPGCTLLAGVESDILLDGSLDYDDDVLDGLEFVVASVHGRRRQDAPAMTARLVAAAKHPQTSVVGHPTGRLLLGREPAPFDVEAFLDACAESGCAVELNANPARLDLSVAHLKLAKERGVLISIAADAHSMQELQNLEHGVAIARRAGLCAEDVLNARSLEELRQWLAARG